MSHARALKMAAAGIVVVGGALWFAPPQQLVDLLAPEAPVAARAPAPKAEVTGQPARLVAALNPLSALTADALKDTLERPLFNPGRAARPADAPAPPPPPEVTDVVPPEEGINAADLSLLAVAGTSGDLVAMVRWAKTNQVYRLKRGQFLSELEMVTVSEREAVFKKDEKVIVLALFTKTKNDAADGAAAVPELDGGQPVVPDAGAGMPAPDDMADQPTAEELAADEAANDETSDLPPDDSEVIDEDQGAPDPDPGAAVTTDGSVE